MSFCILLHVLVMSREDAVSLQFALIMRDVSAAEDVGKSLCRTLTQFNLVSESRETLAKIIGALHRNLWFLQL